MTDIEQPMFTDHQARVGGDRLKIIRQFTDEYQWVEEYLPVCFRATLPINDDSRNPEVVEALRRAVKDDGTTIDAMTGVPSSEDV